ncbi:MAG: DUF2490 domain-containing protein [Pseudomonadota bacterium]
MTIIAKLRRGRAASFARRVVRKALAGCLGVLAIGLAPSPAAADDFQAWTALFSNGAITKNDAGDDGRLLVWFDGHARYRDDASELGVSIIRPGVGWRVNKGLSLWAGYARVISRDNQTALSKENRIWQQATYPIATLYGGRLTGRTRLEQRLLNTGDDTGWRARQFVRYGRSFQGTDFSFIAWNELFIALNDTDWGAEAGYNQNRTFIGAGWQPSPSLRLEAGYLLNHINLQGSPDATNNNIAFSIVAPL